MSETFDAPDPQQDPLRQDGARPPEEIVQILQTYKAEAEEARKSGTNPRDDTWEQNWDLYWGRFDFSKKAAWQSRLAMPEFQQAVDRYAAALREALNQAGDWYDVKVPGDNEGDLTQHIKKAMQHILRRCGRTYDGHEMEFGGVFEELMKAGAITAISAAVTWKGYVSCESVDARDVWLDHTGRHLYRRRRHHIDKHELVAMAKKADARGVPLFNTSEIERLASNIDEEAKNNRERSSGSGQDISSTRKPVALDEWLCTLVDQNGDVIAENTLCVVANDNFLIRGPESNPFWHGMDWISFAPMISVPFSVYGRSYMENWASVALAFNELTNLLMDATFTAAMKAFAMVPEMLEDPSEADEGVHPNKTFLLEGGSNAREFLHAIELGDVPQDAVHMWQGVKGELREGQQLNEIALGQLAPGDKTATEISEVSQSSSATIRSMARGIEVRHLEVLLRLMWYTWIQHADFNDPTIRQEIGDEAAQMFETRRREFATKQITVVVNGISGLVDRAQKLRNLLGFLRTVAQSEPLLAEFFKTHDARKLMQYIMQLFGVDGSRLELSERERMLRQLVAQVAESLQGGRAPQQSGRSQSPSNGTAPPQAAVEGSA